MNEIALGIMLFTIAVLTVDGINRIAVPKTNAYRIHVRNRAGDEEVESALQDMLREGLPAWAGSLTVEIQNGVVQVNKTQMALGRCDTAAGIIYIYANVIRDTLPRYPGNTVAQMARKVFAHEMGHFLGVSHSEFDKIQD